MTASPKTLALRYRIWCFAKEREWDVTVMEIAEALDESVQRVNNTVRQAGWSERLRVAFGADYSAGGAVRNLERPIIRDVLAGRVEAGTL